MILILTERLIKQYDAWPGWAQNFVKALTITIPIYFSALLGVWIQNISGKKLAAHAIIIIILLTFLVWIYYTLRVTREKMQMLEIKRNRALLQAYSYINRYIMDNLTAFHKGLDSYNNFNDNRLLTKTLFRSYENFQLLSEMLYNTLESHFGDEENIENRIEFEVTFMTRSYIDGEITIPVCANRDKRAPRSMLLRKENHYIYNDTVTAEIYRDVRPKPRIIENTADNNNYKEIYSGQKSRIQSSIIYPVLSDTNELLGTLVVHCNLARFFKERDVKYWCELLEIFSKRIAIEKVQLDRLYADLNEKTVTFTLEKLF